MGHVIGLEKFLGLEKANIPPPVNTAQSLFQVIAGTFGSRENAQAMVDTLKKAGIESYINQK
jgi:N-acetylmuramoyl-L-alanine amidase